MHKSFAVPQKLVFTSVLENQSDSPDNKRMTLAGLSMFQISSPFLSTRPLQRWGKFWLKQDRSVVMKFSTALARGSILSGSGQLTTSVLRHVSIVPDVPNSSKYIQEPPKATIYGLWKEAVISIVYARLSWTINAAHKPTAFHRYPSSFHRLPTNQEISQNTRINKGISTS